MVRVRVEVKEETPRGRHTIHIDTEQLHRKKLQTRLILAAIKERQTPSTNSEQKDRRAKNNLFSLYR
jgi:hypothetical protein